MKPTGNKALLCIISISGFSAFVLSLKGARLQDIFSIYLATLIQPWELLKQHALPLTGGLMILGMLISITIWPRNRRAGIAPEIILYAFFHSLLAIKELTITGNFVLYTQQLALLICVFTINSYVLPAFDLQIKQISNLAWLVSIAIIIFLVATAHQSLIDPHAAFWRGRLNGVSSHPNFTGTIFATGALTAMYFHFKLKHFKLGKFSSLIMLMVMIACTFATGSRASMLFVIIGLSVYLKFKPSIIPLVVISGGIFGVGVWLLYNHSIFLQDYTSARALSLENTRAQVLASLWHDFTNNLAFGAPTLDTQTSNSILLSGARIGILGPIICLVIIAQSLSIAFKNITRTPTKHPLALEGYYYASMTLGFLSLLMLEGYFCDSATFRLLIFIATLAFNNYHFKALHPR